jgi:hypothetical protein
MQRFHITQDDTHFWQLTLEREDGSLTQISHQFSFPDQLIEDAHELVRSGEFDAAEVLVEPPRPVVAELAAGPREYRRPGPRKVRE